ncbi:MAG: manganese efflux pump [Clostridia bacterium]|nr:manganese efflux pump [Clostridia bacterium]
MTLPEILLLGIGLSMDAAGVTIANALAYRCEKREQLTMALLFGGFQGLMPLLGYLTGGLFAALVHRFSGPVTLAALGFVGGKMILEGCRAPQTADRPQSLTPATLLLQAVATSIDAFAVGLSLLALEVPIAKASALIALTTLLCSLTAARLGRRFGPALGGKAQLLGGVILLLIAFKAVL